ncbi:GAF and ANTAR domain-containing protein [Cryptosporangium aurantiacum]|uniref:GAF domain-containing protein n=1 Tax=Cryptosporangium aurantiacum TaxID=134849 RepID=A0A1M7RNH2_9ACTN|nr:GAF and ANTAR domain-containing protein [Cryptosporangium aurantiacum]SHN47642.1 GAF domain-containing protein [Cryptosporangium aurantiacum]
MDNTSPAPLADLNAELFSLLAGSPGMGEFLEHVVVLASDVVDPAAACGLTAHRDGQPFTAATSAELAARVDEIQYDADQGPCLEALHTGRAVWVDDLSVDVRWPRYRMPALAAGVASSLSLPLRVDGHTVAALNLYSVQARAFTSPARQFAEAYAAQCAAALTLALRHASQAQVEEQLNAALASRSVIDQALGILMGQQLCTPTRAFQLLREASQHRNRKLRDVAADVITRVTGQPPQEPSVSRATPSEFVRYGS